MGRSKYENDPNTVDNFFYLTKDMAWALPKPLHDKASSDRNTVHKIDISKYPQYDQKIINKEVQRWDCEDTFKSLDNTISITQYIMKNHKLFLWVYTAYGYK